LAVDPNVVAAEIIAIEQELELLVERLALLRPLES
jgi:hypothetical protein